MTAIQQMNYKFEIKFASQLKKYQIILRPMNQHIEDFQVVFPNYQEVYEKIIKALDIDKTKDYSEFHNLLNDTDKLFMFAYEQGILEIVIFLYEYLNTSYNEKILNIYSINNDPQLQQVVAANIVLSNDNVKISDKEIGSYAGGLNPCVKYLNKMRKYSQRKFIKGVGGFYSLNPKYLLNMTEVYNLDLLTVQ